MGVRRYVGKALLTAVAARRRVRGPLRESWPLELEAVTRVMHHYSKRSTRLPLDWQRRVLHVFAPSPSIPDVDIQEVEVRGVPCAWFRPAGADPDRVLVYLHGGGYSIGSIETHRPWIAMLARQAGVYAFAVDYRLAPEHPFPAQLDDARQAWAHLLEIGVDPKRTVWAGESAGGGLTMSTMVASRDEGDPLPAAAAVLSPWVDLTLAGPSIDENARFDYLSRPVLDVYVRRLAPGRDPGHPLLSPARADLRGLPPLLVQVGGAEALLDDSILLSNRARNAGVDVRLSVYEDMVHAFMLLPNLPESARAVKELVAFVRAHTDP